VVNPNPIRPSTSAEHIITVEVGPSVQLDQQQDDRQDQTEDEGQAGREGRRTSGRQDEDEEQPPEEEPIPNNCKGHLVYC